MPVPAALDPLLKQCQPCFHTRIGRQSFRFLGDQTIWSEIARFYRPYFVFSSGDSPETAIAVYAVLDKTLKTTPPVTDMRKYIARSLDVQRDGAIEVHYRPAGPRVYVDRTSRRVIVVAGHGLELLLQCRVMVRDQLFRPQERMNGYFSFHASAVVRGGKATLFMGERNAGKTTCMLSCLAGGRYSLLSADRVILSIQNGKVVVKGTPARCNIHRQTMESDPLLQGIAANHVDQYDHEGKTLVPIDRIAELAGVNVTATAELGAIVLPRVDPSRVGVELALIDKPELRRKLLYDSLLECNSAADGYGLWFEFFEEKREENEHAIARIVELMARDASFISIAASHAKLVEKLRASDIESFPAAIAP